MDLTLQSTITLNNGVTMPMFGLGVYHASAGSETRDAVSEALRVGYRLIDTASIYNNEQDVGAGIKASGVAREDVFVTTKLWNADHGREAPVKALEQSLKKLQVEYVDLYLIHWPVANLRKHSWEVLEKLLQAGKCKAIGVSNYMIRHLDELGGGLSVVPAVNQVEFHPFLFQEKLLQYCRQRNIVLQSYSPLTRGQRLENATIKKLAAKYNKTPAQLLIRWNLEHQVVVIPKSTKPERIAENANVFDFSISADDMKILNGLNENLHTGWDPSTAP